MREPERGDLIELAWVDIMEEINGDPDQAALARRTSIGFFWERRSSCGVPAIITTTTLDEDLAGQNGFCIYPEATVVRIRVIKRARRAQKRGRALHPVPRTDGTGAPKVDLP